MLSLAEQTARQAHGAAVAIVLMVLLVLIGIVVILLLGAAWRRYNQRINRPRPQHGETTDLWQAAAERLYHDDKSGTPDDPDEPSDPSDESHGPDR